MKYLYLFLMINAVLLSCNNTSGDSDYAQNDDQRESQEENIKYDDQHVHEPSEKPEGSAKSPRKAVMGNINDTHIHIDYSAPSMRGRKIFGGLVAYDEVWVTGAHKATSIHFHEDVLVEGVKVEKGKYGIFTIPDRDEWTVILNKNYDMHLADDYKKEEDVLRFNVEPEKLDNPVEQLTFEVVPAGEDQGRVNILWEDVKISFNVRSR